MTEKQELEQCQVFSISKGTFTQQTAKSWSLVMREEKLHLFDGGLYYLQLSKSIIKIKYPQSHVLFSRNDNTYIAMVFFPSNSELNPIVEYKLQEGGSQLLEWQQCSKKVQEDMLAICGKTIATQFNPTQPPKKGIGYKIGGFFGAINAIVAKPSKKINQATEEKVQQIKEEQLSEENKGKWKRFTEKAQALNHQAGQIIKPAKDKVAGITDKIGEKFSNSENSLIKSIREFGIGLKDSLNEGYKSSLRSKEQVVQMQPKAPQSQRHLK